MKKIGLGQIVGIFANVGVLAGIVFLGIEIRQNTRSLEINAYQDLISQISQISQISEIGAFYVEVPEEILEVEALLFLSPDEHLRC